MERSVLTTQIGSLLEALHPDGAAAAAQLVTAADAATATAQLPPDGIAWVCPPRGRRRAARRELERAGLVVEGAWIAVPASGPRQLVPLEPWALRRALADSPLRRLRGLPGWGLGAIAEAARSVGIVARRSEARPALQWLEHAAAGRDALPIVRRSWSGAGVLLVLRDGRLVKTASSSEAQALVELGPGAREAGAAVPRVLFSGAAGKRFVLTLDPVPGVLAASLLSGRPGRVADVVTRVSTWLERWHSLTRVERRLSKEDVDRYVLEPLRRLGSAVPADYAHWVAHRAHHLVGADAPLAAAHNDLTTWNVLVDGERVGVVDWEAAAAEAFPLVDLEYFAVDAVATARRLPRAEAFRLCAGREHAEGRLVCALRERIARSLDVPAPLAELARHAAWLGHAANESERPDARRDEAFATIVGLLAATVA